MKKILLPTDFSDNAWNAIFTAVKLYANVKCSFYLLHAYEPKAMNMLGRKNQQRLGVIYDSLAEHSKQELDKIIVYLKKNHHNPNHGFSGISKSDSLDNAVMEVIAKEGIDLIVMGTQGATGAKEIFMGSNTVKVLKHIKDYPVLAVPADYNFQRLQSVAFPTDFTRIYHKYELLPLLELTSLWKAKIQVLHVADEFIMNNIQKANRKILEEQLRAADHSYNEARFKANIANSIENFVSHAETDLIGLLRHHHTFWEKLIDVPVIKKMAFRSKVPVLFLPEQP